MVYPMSWGRFSSRRTYVRGDQVETLRTRMAIGAMVVSLAIGVVACDNNPDDNGGSTPTEGSTTTTGG